MILQAHSAIDSYGYNIIRPGVSLYLSSIDIDRESIKSLKAEIRGISKALKSHKNGSKKYDKQSRLLTIAKDELKCALEDRTMFRGFTGTTNDATGKENSFFISPSLPTPPLGRTGKSPASKNSGKLV